METAANMLGYAAVIGVASLLPPCKHDGIERPSPVDQSRQIEIARSETRAGTALRLIWPTLALRQNITDNISMHIRQTEVAAGVVKGEAFMIQTQTVQYRRLKVMYVNRIFRNMKSKIVGGSERHAGSYSAAR